MDKSKPYLPKERTCYHPKNKDVNNIAWQEFDYTENMTDDKTL